MTKEKICNFISFIMHEDEEPSNTRSSFVLNEFIDPIILKEFRIEEDDPTSLSSDTLPKGGVYYNYFTTINSWDELQKLCSDLKERDFTLYHMGKKMNDFEDLKNSVIREWRK